MTEFNTSVLFFEGSKPPPELTGVRLWRVTQNVWVILAESSADSLLFQPTTTGGILFSPYGKNSKVEVIFNGSDEMQKEFENCRVYQEIQMCPNDGTTNKYFLCKCALPAEWTEAKERALMSIAEAFVWGSRWTETTPTAEWHGLSGDTN